MLNRDLMTPLNHMRLLSDACDINLNQLYAMRRANELIMPITEEELAKLKKIGEQIKIGIRRNKRKG